MIVTLLSDFGYKDHYIAKVKGILLRQSNIEKIIDITHDVTPMSFLHASYAFKNSYKYFPEQTVHISLMSIMDNVTAQKPAKALMYQKNGQLIISADNGFLPFTFSRDDIQAYELPVHATDYYDWLRQVAAFLGAWNFNDEVLNTLQLMAPEHTAKSVATIFKEDSIETFVIYIDNYCNVILNITKDQFESARRGRKFEVQFARSEKLEKLYANYQDVEKSSALCRFNSDGYMEIAIRNGKAADLLGMHVYNSENLIYNTIKIVFHNA